MKHLRNLKDLTIHAVKPIRDECKPAPPKFLKGVADFGSHVEVQDDL